MLPYKVFISHCTKDAAQVERLRSVLEAAGVGAYVCSNDVRPGASLSEKLQAQIRSSDAVLVVFTADAGSSAYVQQEIGFALSAKKKVVPFVDETSVANLDLAMLGGVEQIRFDPEDPLPAITRALAFFRHDHEQQILWTVILLAALTAGIFYMSRT